MGEEVSFIKNPLTKFEWLLINKIYGDPMKSKINPMVLIRKLRKANAK